MRVVRAVVLLMLGSALAVASWGPLGNLFSDEQDSPAWMYVAYGLPPLALGVLCIAIAARWLRHH
jgi:hypothetical protein